MNLRHGGVKEVEQDFELFDGSGAVALTRLFFWYV